MINNQLTMEGKMRKSNSISENCENFPMMSQTYKAKQRLNEQGKQLEM